MENPIKMDDLGVYTTIFGNILVVEKFFYDMIFTVNLGEMIQFDEHMFQMGRFNHQLESRISFSGTLNFRPNVYEDMYHTKKYTGGWWVRGESRWRKKTKRSQSEFPQTLNIFLNLYSNF